MDAPQLELSGLVRSERVRFDRAALARLPGQVPDVGALVPGRRGRGVRLKSVLEAAGFDRKAGYANLLSSDPSFAVSVPLAEVLEQGVIVYEQDDAALAPEKGGPFRLLVSGHADECVHVKALERVELSARPGRDTRPKDDAEHQKLHEQNRKPRP
jgi:DMSO/TMAO reductase YedYZ molybdopterin-dependent catalytic subunit